MTGQNPHVPRLLVYLALLACVIAYWQGLYGPFLLDDRPNLTPLQKWLDGQASVPELILGNESGRLGRSVSMATLWFSAATGGMHPFPFKLGNLVIHILCGLIGLQLLKRLLMEDPRLSNRAGVAAAVLAGLWLLMPMNVSTVLYAVQRMAQMSTLFVLAAVWAYVVARQQLARGQVRQATLKLFILFPLLLLLGLLSKENAAVTILLCAVVELAYFLKQPRQGKALPAFYGLFLLAPALLVGAALLVAPDRVIGSYQGREFTLVERLLSQPRALWDYIGLIAWPRGGYMGVFVDDFHPSSGLLSPPSTLIALLGLVATSAFAIALRKQAPSVFAGWFFFLAAHSIESTIFPLELYFQHRNYLPSFGLLLAASGLLSWLAGKLPALTPVRTAVIGYSMAAVAAACFTMVTWQQAQVWRSELAIAEQALQYRPDSLRAALSKVTGLVHNGQYEQAMAITSSFIDSPKATHRLLGNLHTLTIDCIRGNGADPAYLRQAESSGVSYVTLGAAQALVPLSRALGTGRCGPNVTDEMVADSISRLLDNLQQSDEAQAKWSMRATLANMYLQIGRIDKALVQAQLAWQPQASDPAIGGMLVGIYLSLGNIDAAQHTLNEVKSRVRSYEVEAMASIAFVQGQIDAARAR